VVSWKEVEKAFTHDAVLAIYLSELLGDLLCPVRTGVVHHYNLPVDTTGASVKFRVVAHLVSNVFARSQTITGRFLLSL
jgi:hypothetical protein